MSKPTKEAGLYAPKERERGNGTSFVYEKSARSDCKVCDGFGEFHVPYEDYDTYIIHRCECTDEPQAVAEPKRITEFTECAECAAKPGSPALCVACCANRECISQLERRVEELESGACRFHCRVRADMWKAGGAYVYENWNKCAVPAPCHLDQMYNEWRKHDAEDKGTD